MANQCKYTKEVLQVSYDSGVTWVNIGETQKGDLYEYDSAECGAVTQYRWVDVTGAYTCEGTTKYQKTKKQYSTDGTTWQDVSPAEYGKGQVLEYDSVDCGGGGGDYRNQYLTFVAIDDAQFHYIEDGSNFTLSYSIDGGNTWSELQPRTNTPTVYAGQKIMWKGNIPSPTYEYAPSFNSNPNYRFNVEGNIMSLLYGDDFADKTTLSTSALRGTFAYCYRLISAENLVLPATTLVDECYMHMFYHCNRLTTAPRILPATTLAYRCYYMMFIGCTSLTTAPQLPATTLAERCYEQMFQNCASLTTAPQLPATTLASFCYCLMFGSCTSLTTAPQLPATTLADGCYFSMFEGCTSLTTAPELPATTLARECYGWMFVACSGLTTAPRILSATTLQEASYNRMFAGCTSLTTSPVISAVTLADNCCDGMFEGCTSLTVPPELPTTTLSPLCYYRMFEGCTSLTTAPSLPATTLANGCYVEMFSGCTSLTTAPVLSATTLVYGCYEYMFSGCINLGYIKCLATNVSARRCTNEWVTNVSSSGTFVKASSMSGWSRGNSGIPTNWSVQNA